MTMCDTAVCILICSNIYIIFSILYVYILNMQTHSCMHNIFCECFEGKTEDHRRQIYTQAVQLIFIKGSVTLKYSGPLPYRGPLFAVSLHHGFLNCIWYHGFFAMSQNFVEKIFFAIYYCGELC